jgi:hypothetical protein
VSLRGKERREPKRFEQLGLWSARRLGSSSVAPTKHPRRPERVPPTRLTHRFAERKGERLFVRAIEEPSTVGLPPAFDKMHGIADARVRLDIGVPEVVKRTENVVMVAGRERELQLFPPFRRRPSRFGRPGASGGRTGYSGGGLGGYGRTPPPERQKPNGGQTSAEGSSIHQKFRKDNGRLKNAQQGV